MINVIVAGTFDGIHKGHEALLRTAFLSGDYVFIGLTSDKYISEFKKDMEIRPYDQRKNELLSWLSPQYSENEYELVAIDDPFGPAVSNVEISKIIVSENTVGKAREINSIRKTNKLPEIEIISIPMVLAYDGIPISSTRIRKDETDRFGDKIMPQDLKSLLRKPLGPVLKGDGRFESCRRNAGKYLITVGDITTHTLIEKGFFPDLAIIDLSAQRQPYDTLDHIPISYGYQMVHIKNPPGHISFEAVTAIIKTFESNYKTVIIAEGEEDLLVLPAVIHAPVGSVLYYGQPPLAIDGSNDQHEEGLVELQITDELKKQVKLIIDRFCKKEDIN